MDNEDPSEPPAEAKPDGERRTVTNELRILSIGAASAFSGVCTVFMAAYVAVDPKLLDSNLRTGLSLLCLALPVLLTSLWFSAWQKWWRYSGILAYATLVIGGTVLVQAISSILRHIDEFSSTIFMIAGSLCVLFIAFSTLVMKYDVSHRRKLPAKNTQKDAAQ